MAHRPDQRDSAKQGDGGRSSDEVAAELLSEGKLLPALRILDHNIDLGLADATTWRLMGTGLAQLGEFAQAIGALQRSAELDSTNLETAFQLASCQFEMGDIVAAVDRFEDLAHSHNHLNAWCNLATIIPGDPRADQERILDVRRQFAKRLVETEPTRLTDWQVANASRSRLRIGYLSAFFHRENYMKPVWELIRRHDRSRFEIHLFADDVEVGDLGWFQPAGDDRIHETTQLDNLSLAKLIRAHELDVLVDLNAYSVPLRLPIFVQRLAKTVAAWFNMYATSGFSEVDWIIGDEFVIPTAEEGFYTERVARLSQSYLTFNVTYEAPPVSPPPCLENGYLTFGSLISQYKISATVYEAWSRILKACPAAMLVLGNRALTSRVNREYVLQQFQRHGIDDSRLVFLPAAAHQEFLQYYDQIDIALDAFPYNGGTTTTEAMWQGVPTLAINGDRWAGRTSLTLLANAGLSEYVSPCVDSMVATAERLARDPMTPARLASQRAGMREQLQDSAVCDTAAMVRSFEQTLERIARDGSAGSDPSSSC